MILHSKSKKVRRGLLPTFRIWKAAEMFTIFLSVFLSKHVKYLFESLVKRHWNYLLLAGGANGESTIILLLNFPSDSQLANPFSDDSVCPSSILTMQDILLDVEHRDFLQIELAAIVDIGKRFLKQPICLKEIHFFLYMHIQYFVSWKLECKWYEMP